MKSRNLYLTFYLMMALVASAANYEVTGNVSDAVTTETLPGATFAIYALNDTIEPIISGMTDEKGGFKTDLEKMGNYKAKFSFTGMEDTWRDFNINEKTTSVNFGNIALLPDAEMLEEIVVVGKRPIVEANGEKITYNVDEDPSAMTNTVLEMLRKVPMVTVDGQDNILINGQSNFSVYVNGKPDPMMSNNASDILKNMPASSIKKIEVITEPGAKYDAEGTGGILNIVTVGKTSIEGYLAVLSALVGTSRSGIGTYARSKINKVTGSVNIQINDVGNIMPSTHNKTQVDRNEPENTDNQHLVQNIRSGNKSRFTYGNMQLSWEPDTLNLFTMSASYMYVTGKQNLTTLSTMYKADSSVNWNNTQWMKSNYSWGEFTGNVNYQHDFGSPQHNIVASYQYAHGTNKNKLDQYYYDLNNYPITDPYIRQESANPTNEHTFQVDYTLPIRTLSVFEAGLKGILRRNYGNGYTYSGDSFSNMVLQSENMVDMEQYQNVGALYASYSTKWKKWSAKAGLRYEYTHMGVEFDKGNYEDFATDLNDIVPNGAISYNFAPAKSLRLAYQMRIRRPGIDEINPYAEEILSDYVRVGNPDLTSEKTHNVTLTYSNFGGMIGGNIQLTYTYCNNQIGEISLLKDGILQDTYGNIGHKQQIYLNSYISIRPSQKINISLNGNFSYDRYKYDVDNIDRHKWSINASTNFTYNMPWRLILIAYGGASTPTISLQSDISGWYYYGLSLTRSFLKDDKLKISIAANNFLTKSQIHKAKTYGDGFTVKTRNANTSWGVNLVVSYTLGSMNVDVKRTANSIVNDDVQNNKK